jgi:hypothetical protein
VVVVVNAAASMRGVAGTRAQGMRMPAARVTAVLLRVVVGILVLPAAAAALLLVAAGHSVVAAVVRLLRVVAAERVVVTPGSRFVAED